MQTWLGRITSRAHWLTAELLWCPVGRTCWQSALERAGKAVHGELVHRRSSITPYKGTVGEEAECADYHALQELHPGDAAHVTGVGSALLQIHGVGGEGCWKELPAAECC